jgi:hypothetical protein
VTPKFNEEENRQLDKRIFILIDKITVGIKNSEVNIKNIGAIQLESSSEMAMKENIKIYLAAKLQEISKKVRQNEEEYVSRFREFCSNDLKNNYNSNEKLENSFEKPRSFWELDKSDELLKQRDFEINKLLSSISDLGLIFTEMSNLIQIQGNILF